MVDMSAFALVTDVTIFSLLVLMFLVAWASLAVRDGFGSKGAVAGWVLGVLFGGVVLVGGMLYSYEEAARAEAAAVEGLAVEAGVESVVFDESLRGVYYGLLESESDSVKGFVTMVDGGVELEVPVVWSLGSDNVAVVNVLGVSGERLPFSVDSVREGSSGVVS